VFLIKDILETSTAFYIPKSSLDGGAYLNLRSKLSIIDFKTNAQIPKAFFEINVGDDIMIGIPKISKNIIASVTRTYYNYKPLPLYETDRIGYNLAYPPLDHQKDIAKKLRDQYLFQEDKRCILALAPGLSLSKPLRI
jgi:hypothetical protein